MDPATENTSAKEAALEAPAPAHVEATEPTPAAPAPTEPKAAVDDLAKAAETSSPFGTIKRRTTEAWNSIPKPAGPTEFPQFPSISSELPTQESARETFGTLKRRTTETFGTLQRRTTNLMKNVNVPSVPQVPNLAGTEMPKWANFSDLASKLPKAPWGGQGQGAQHGEPTLPATWERIFVPALPRSSHSINVVGGNAYIFGGEVEPRKPVDNDMHLIVLPYSSASADYIALRPLRPRLPVAGAAALRAEVPREVHANGGVVASRGGEVRGFGAGGRRDGRQSRVEEAPEVRLGVEHPHAAVLFDRGHVGPAAAAEEEDARPDYRGGVAHARAGDGAEVRGVG